MKTRKKVVFLVWTVLVFTFVSVAGISVYAFSDEYEPYYPHITAVTRSVDEIYQRITRQDYDYSDVQEKALRDMIQMYKDVGIDVSLDMEHNLSSYRMIADFPQSWSTETPIPLGESPDYSGAFSIDAPWNNKIPEDAPRSYMPPESLIPRINLAVVKANVDDGGYGTGIPIIVSNSSDPFMTIASKYSTGSVGKVFYVHVREDFRDYINNNKVGDEHVQFIDSETNTSVQTWATRGIQGDTRGYRFVHTGALPDYDIRAGAVSLEFRLDGIGAEGQAGVNAANPPTMAFTLKSSEVQSTTELFNHALGGAIGQNIGARVFPSISVDASSFVKDNKGSNRLYNIGVLPYGGVAQLDPELDLDKLYYTDKKISFHTYRILKAMQEYGFYNIDCSGGNGVGGILMYTSTYSKDYINPNFEGFNVPYKDGAQGFANVNAELHAILYNDWEWFGLKEQPKLYVTVPVVKYADLDVNDDGVIDQTDHDLVAQHSGEAYSEANKQYDVNQDKEISPADIEIMYNYLNDLPMHTFTWHDVTYVDNDDVHGRIVIAGVEKKIDGVTKYRDGDVVSFGIDAENGWEFDGWTGDFAKYGKQPAVKVTLTESLSIGAKYKKKKEVKVDFKVAGPGHIESTDNGISYDAPKNAYGYRDLIGIKAVADEGYEFLGWAGDMSGFTNPLEFLVEKDMEIVALFGKKGYSEEFDPENWEHISGDESAYTIKKGSGFSFGEPAFKQAKLMAIRKNTDKAINLEGDFSIRISFAALKSKGDSIQGKLIFNYKNDKNYYYVSLAGSGYMEFGKVYNGTASVLKKAAGKGKEITVNDIMLVPAMDLEVVRKGAYLYINGYKQGAKYEYCKVRDKSHKGGTIGIGGMYYGYGSLSGIVVSNSVVDEKSATLQKWTPRGDTSPWVEKLRDAVVIAVDSEKAYIKGEYTTVPEKSGNAFFADDGEMVYVPVRYVTEKLGGKVSYDPATDSVVVSYGDKSGSFKAWENGAKEVNGTLYVTAYDLAKALGKEYYIYERVVFFTDEKCAYNDGGGSEPECQEFIRKAFNINYYM